MLLLLIYSFLFFINIQLCKKCKNIAIIKIDNKKYN